jgi:hypothetical protein
MPASPICAFSRFRGWSSIRMAHLAELSRSPITPKMVLRCFRWSGCRATTHQGKLVASGDCRVRPTTSARLPVSRASLSPPDGARSPIDQASGCLFLPLYTQLSRRPHRDCTGTTREPRRSTSYRRSEVLRRGSLDVPMRSPCGYGGIGSQPARAGPFHSKEGRTSTLSGVSQRHGGFH